jgi:ectoine hydroxylase-related dioxygenase (phytanoyl-CoA dioxygenase family)
MFKELGYEIIYDLEIPTGVRWEAIKQTVAGLNEAGEGWVMNKPGNPCKLDAAFRLENFRLIAEHPQILSKAREILGQEKLDTYISKFFPMIPENGFSVDWHQDNFYIRANPEKMISCDVFIDGATKEMGGLRVIPRSHRRKHGVFPHEKGSHGVFNWMDVSENHPQIVDIDIDKPFAILFDVNLVHTCYRNTSEVYRPSLAWEYKHRGYLPPTHNGHLSQDEYEI